jgi:multiple sugar transport system permease protein
MYLELNALGWLDSLVALIIPPSASAFGVFLLHQFFLGIPRSLDESVYIDGGTRWHVFRHVAVPVAKPAIITLGIFVFIASWNDFIGPMVYIDSADNFTLPVGIALFQTSYYTEYGLTLAASVIATIPVIAVFLLYQRRITEGIALTGLKE